MSDKKGEEPAQPDQASDDGSFMVLQLRPKAGAPVQTTKVHYPKWPAKYFFAVKTRLEEETLLAAQRKHTKRVTEDGMEREERDQLAEQKEIIRGQVVDFLIPAHDPERGLVDLPYNVANMEEVLSSIELRLWLNQQVWRFAGMIESRLITTLAKDGSSFRPA